MNKKFYTPSDDKLVKLRINNFIQNIYMFLYMTNLLLPIRTFEDGIDGFSPGSIVENW